MSEPVITLRMTLSEAKEIYYRLRGSGIVMDRLLKLLTIAIQEGPKIKRPKESNEFSASSTEGVLPDEEVEG